MNGDYSLRVAYDAEALVRPDRGTGKGLQLRNLLGPHITTFTGLAPKTPVQCDIPLIRQGRRRYLVWQQLSLAKMVFQAKPDVFLAPYNTAPLLIPPKTRVILVLHDLILLERFPGTRVRELAFNAYRGMLIYPSVARSSLVVTVSGFSRSEILKRFPEANVTVIPCTIPDSWFITRDQLCLKKQNNYILLVTSTPPHKNVTRALQAYARYVTHVGNRAAALRVLGLSGAVATYQAKARELNIQHLVSFEPFVPESKLQELYRAAMAVLVPSLMEGFGIPVLEAMASGTPVVCSNTTSLPEVGGAAPDYFNPYDVEDMAASLVRVSDDEARRTKMVETGLAQAKSFHPSVISKQIHQFWAGLPEALERRR